MAAASFNLIQQIHVDVHYHRQVPAPLTAGGWRCLPHSRPGALTRVLTAAAVARNGDIASPSNSAPAPAVHPAGQQQQQHPQLQQKTHDFSESELRQVWDSVTRALLKLGKSGATEAHARSLSELVSSHQLVKVQLNGAHDPQATVAVAQSLAQQAANTAELLQIKGSTMLFADGSSSKDELLAAAAAAAAGTAAWKAKRHKAAEQRQEQRDASATKQASSASRRRKRVSQLISNASSGHSRGGIDKATLAQEWQQLAAKLESEEVAGGTAASKDNSKS